MIFYGFDDVEEGERGGTEVDTRSVQGVSPSLHIKALILRETFIYNIIV